MSEYLLLLAEDENGYATASEELYARVLQAHNDFAAKWGSKLRGGNALQPTSTATVVRPDGAGDFTVTDGPFIETKEALGGYYLIEAADLDEAITIAKDVPVFFGCVEVRPVMVFE